MGKNEEKQKLLTDLLSGESKTSEEFRDTFTGRLMTEKDIEIAGKIHIPLFHLNIIYVSTLKAIFENDNQIDVLKSICMEQAKLINEMMQKNLKRSIQE